MIDEDEADGADRDAIDDAMVVEAQLGRALRGDSRVVARCPLALPVVVEVPPVLDDGTPFPTRYWLTCPLAHRRIARLEAEGAVRAWDERLRLDGALAESMQRAHARYAAARDAAVPGDATHRPAGGVAGIRGTGVKCLHAHYADHAAGGDNPVGEETAAAIEPLDCARPCVVARDGGAERDPGWTEPSP